MEHLERLEAELKVIDLWDERYLQDATHSEADELSYRIRGVRRREIVRKIEASARPTENQNEPSHLPNPLRSATELNWRFARRHCWR